MKNYQKTARTYSTSKIIFVLITMTLVLKGSVFAQWAGGTQSSSIIYRSGIVGIGYTTAPTCTTYVLQVNGNMIAKDITVQPSWSDFVFGKDYNLMPLNEVANYIEKYKHLPDIPTAEEVEKNGVQIGQMESKLLQKIEELTLYMIKIQKESDELQAKLDALEKEN